MNDGVGCEVCGEFAHDWDEEDKDKCEETKGTCEPFGAGAECVDEGEGEGDVEDDFMPSVYDVCGIVYVIVCVNECVYLVCVMIINVYDLI